MALYKHKEPMKEDEKRFVLRMPKSTHEWLIERAKENGRSANAEALQIFKKARRQEETNK